MVFDLEKTGASLVARWMGRWWGAGGLERAAEAARYGEKAKGGFRRRGAPKKNEREEGGRGTG